MGIAIRTKETSSYLTKLEIAGYPLSRQHYVCLCKCRLLHPCIYLLLWDIKQHKPAEVEIECYRFAIECVSYLDAMI